MHTWKVNWELIVWNDSIHSRNDFMAILVFPFVDLSICAQPPRGKMPRDDSRSTNENLRDFRVQTIGIAQGGRHLNPNLSNANMTSATTSLNSHSRCIEPSENIVSTSPSPNYTISQLECKQDSISVQYAFVKRIAWIWSKKYTDMSCLSSVNNRNFHPYSSSTWWLDVHRHQSMESFLYLVHPLHVHDKA